MMYVQHTWEGSGAALFCCSSLHTWGKKEKKLSLLVRNGAAAAAGMQRED